VRLPASSDPGIFAAQAAMVEAWQIAAEQFFDADMHHTNWPDELLRHMAAAYTAKDPAAAYGEISALLSDLGDPYTRIVPAE
jgi:C-terminal processing protease CtpA/Prc